VKVLIIIFGIAGVYIFVVFFLSRVFIPHLRKIVVPEKVNDDFTKTVRALSAQEPDVLRFLQALMDNLKERYITTRHQSDFMPWILFRRNIDKIWHQKGYNQSCNVLNFVFKTMIIKSGRFTEKEVQEKLTWVKLSIHQYLEIKMKDGSIVYVDPWGYLSGRTKLGQYASGINGSKGQRVWRAEHVS
jgi:hypothetical protein